MKILLVNASYSKEDFQEVLGEVTNQNSILPPELKRQLVANAVFHLNYGYPAMMRTGQGREGDVNARDEMTAQFREVEPNGVTEGLRMVEEQYQKDNEST